MTSDKCDLDCWEFYKRRIYERRLARGLSARPPDDPGWPWLHLDENAVGIRARRVGGQLILVMSRETLVRSCEVLARPV